MSCAPKGMVDLSIVPLNKYVKDGIYTAHPGESKESPDVHIANSSTNHMQCMALGSQFGIDPQKRNDSNQNLTLGIDPVNRRDVVVPPLLCLVWCRLLTLILVADHRMGRCHATANCQAC